MKKGSSFLKTTGLVLFVFILSGCAVSPSHPAMPGWSAADKIAARINPPTFPDRQFLITDLGATPSPQADCKPALDKAIAQCHVAGGGRVVIPAGTWYIGGPVHLLSHVNLHLADGAILKFSTDPNDYLPVVPTRFEGNEVMNYSPLIYALNQQNIALTGSGILDGQASNQNWWAWTGSGAKAGVPNQKNDADKLRAMGDDNVPIDRRIFGQGHYLRPNFVQFNNCRNVLIEGITINNSPMWCLHPLLCENTTIRRVTVSSHGPNNDGCDPESCRDMLIEDCRFDTGDDCIAIKSGRNGDGRRIARPSENIIIRGCHMQDGHGGVVLGSEMSGGIRNIYAENCVMDSPNLDRAIRLKSNTRRGGYLQNLFVRNIKVGQVAESIFHIDLLYSKETGDFPPRVSSIYLQNITAEKCRLPFYLRGIAEEPIRNLVVENCTIKSIQQPSIIEHVESLTLLNVTLPPQPSPGK